MAKEKYNIEKISFEWVEECKDRKEIKKAYEAIKEYGGYYDLEQALKKKLAELDPTFRRQIDERPLTKQEKETIENDLAMFLDSANYDDESLQGKHTKNIFTNPKEEAAQRIGLKKKAENERLKGNDFMKSKEYDVAIEWYNKAIAIDPTEASTYSNRALAYINKKQYSLAIDDANKSIALDPEYIKGYYRRGKAYENCKKYELAIKDYECILEKEPNNKKIKKELLAVRSSYKDQQDAESGTKKFKKMKIQEESSDKVQEIPSSEQSKNESAIQSDEPIIEEEGVSSQATNPAPVSQITETHPAHEPEPAKVEEPLTSHVEEPTPVLVEEQKENKSEFVKLKIEEEDSSDEELVNAKNAAKAQEPIKSEDIKLEEISHSKITEVSTPDRITEFDKNLMKHENVSEDFIHSFDQVHVTEIPTTTDEESKVEEISEEVKTEITPEEAEEIKFFEQIDQNLEKYKADAKEQHTKGMFEHSIEIYEEALLYIDSVERHFTCKKDDIIARKCSLWNNIAAWYKQYQNSDKQIEFSTLVIDSADHLSKDQSLLFKAYFRRGVAYEKNEKYKKAKEDLEWCKNAQPYNLEVTKALNRVREAVAHEEQLEKIKLKPSATKLTNLLEEFKSKGNEHFKENKIGKFQH